MFSIAVLIPLTSKNRDWKDIFSSFFYQKTFFSILKNYKEGIKIKFYFGIDNDEKIYTKENLNIIFNKINDKLKEQISFELLIYENIEKEYLTKMWNILALKAYNKNIHDYYLQIGDDIIINDNNFLSKCIKIMLKNNNFGITGPTQIGGANTILTQSFVSNKHFKIFNKLFSEEIKNWHCDNWINDIYLPNYNYRINDSFIKNVGNPPRYKYESDSKVIDKLVLRDKQYLEEYIHNNPSILKAKPILIIGNGKSASQIDWTWLNNNKNKIDTFGINSAYKIYNKLNFYPTYYANLDSIVIKSHSKQLQKLLNLKKIKKCFYLNNINFIKNETYYKLCKVPPGWNGISTSNLRFHTWANTGSDCVQLALMMGYKDIYIIGVDGYVEKIKESTQTNKNTLIMKETPKDNPNYWFAEYQEKGDEYNIPHANKWHIPGWDYSAHVCKKLNINYKNLSLNKNYVKSIEFMDYLSFKYKIENY